MTTINAANSAVDNLTLESVQESFNNWRSVRGNERKIPDYLWQQVSAIFPHYRQSKILSALTLNHNQLHKNLHRSAEHQSLLRNIPTKQQEAIPLTSPFVKAFLPTIAENSYQVEWQKSDGSKLIFTHLDTVGLGVLIQNWRI